MRSLLLAASTITMLILCISGSLAETWYIKSDGTGDAPTIQAGIDSASAGDTVLLACGSYYEHDIFMYSGITVRSETGSAECVTIDAQGLGRVLYCDSVDSSTRIEGLTITGGLALGDAWPPGVGGGIASISSFHELTNCLLSGNSADEEGGGMYCYASSPTVTGCDFSGNLSNILHGAGGGMSCWEGSSPAIIDCVFSNNSAKRGGGMKCFRGSSPMIAGCVFTLNSAQTWGGGMYSGDGSHPTITNCIFSGNSSGNGGGGIWISSCYYPDLTITNCIFSGNSGGTGGGVACHASSHPTVTSCTFYGNYGGGLSSYTDSSPTLENTIIAFSVTGKGISCGDAASIPIITCCDIYGNVDGDWVGCIDGQVGINGNFSEDPLFCDPDEGNLSLQNDSPCLNAPECGLVGFPGQPCIRSRIEVSASSLRLPTVTVGDTSSVEFSIFNVGDSVLVISEFEPPSGDMLVTPVTPLVILQDGSESVTLTFYTRQALDISDQLRIISNDPLHGTLEIPLQASVRPLDFSVSDLYPFGEIRQGDPLIVALTMQDSTDSDSAKVFYRWAGETLYRQVALEFTPQPPRDQYSTWIPGDSIAPRGIEYFPRVFNGAAQKSGEIKRLRIRVENLSFPSLQPAGKYSMISIPLETSGNAVGYLVDNLGELDPENWRMFAYESADSLYTELTTSSLFGFDQGRAYWLISKESAQLDTGPLEGLTAPSESSFELALDPGWNLVGNPFNFAVEWELVIRPPEIGNPVAFDPSLGETGDYVEAHVLMPFEGYFLQNTSMQTVTIQIPATEAGASSVKTRRRLLSVRPPEPPGSWVYPPFAIRFPTTTVGDTAKYYLSFVNQGTGELTISGACFSSPLFSFPTDIAQLLQEGLVLPPKSKIDTQVLFTPTGVGDITELLELSSDDQATPGLSLPLTGSGRAIGFSMRDLYVDGIIESDDPLNVFVVMEESVFVDSVVTKCWLDSSRDTNTATMSRIATSPREEWYVAVPIDPAAGRGIAYRVQLYNGKHVIVGDQRNLRMRVRNLMFPFSQLADRYSMISIPLEMQGSILGTLADDIGGPDASVWRMFAYSVPGSSYVEVPRDTLNLDRFQLGRGYWLITTEQVVLSTKPARGITTDATAPYPIVLAPGWNIIGNPFNFPVAWDSIMVDTLTIAESDAIVEPPIRWALSQVYQYGVKTLAPFEGYWVKNLGDSNVVLRIPPRESSVEEQLNFTGVLAQSSIADEDTRKWRIGIKVSSSGAVDMYNYLGVGEGADNQWDVNDRSEPPMSPGTSISLYFPHTSWKKHPGMYSIDVREESQVLDLSQLGFVQSDDECSGHMWRFDVAKGFSVGGAGDKVLLEFDELQCVPAEETVCLVDRHLEKLIDIREESAYCFYLGKRDYVSTEDDARFVLLVGSEEFIERHGDELPEPPAMTALHQNYPNPFNPSTVIRYDIAEPGHVEIAIYDVRGALVKTVLQGNRNPGRYEAGWDSKNNAGARVASGIYFYRLIAGDFVQTRKMMLLR